MPASSDGRFRGYLLAGFAAACWATGGLTAKWLFSPLDATTRHWPVPPLGLTVDPIALSGARALVAFAILAVSLTFVRRDALRVAWRDLPFFVVFGVLGLAMVHFTYFKTLSLTGVATAILLEYLAPVLVMGVSVTLPRREVLRGPCPWPSPSRWRDVRSSSGAIGGGVRSVPPAGVAWGLASAVFFALYTLMGKYAARRFSPWTLLTYGLGAAAIFWLLFVGPVKVVSLLLRPSTFLAVVFIAVVSTILPFVAYLTALHHIDATKATITATLEPALAGIGAFVVLHESLTGLQVLGGVLVVVAIALVQASGKGSGVPPAA